MRAGKSSLAGIFAGLTAAGIWGGVFVVSKAVMEHVPPFTLITIRMILGILTLFPFLAARGGLRISREVFWRLFWVGFVGYGVSIGFQFTGTHLSTAANGALVTSATPAFVLFFAALILKERITFRKFAALALASLGVLAVIDPRQAAFSSSLFLGNLSLVAAATTWALYSVLIRKVTRETDVLTVSLVTFAGAFPVSVPLAAWEISQTGIPSCPPSVCWGILFLGTVSTALAMYLWNTAFALLDAGVASLTFFSQPVIGTLLSAYFLHEKITPLFVLGGILLGAGLLLASGEKNQEESKISRSADSALGNRKT